ncbi:hypothetical protein PsYK624_061790 [Phanerochaete sordida]|uniref:F-box domain-containing protein n=1 Tax=Phanerochaete sordida TaxID=48140 RepID=A0A9P3LC18_9APHY|nr:hypothetical protein PsYK624_061790 [Phanerochaete sordida]
MRAKERPSVDVTRPAVDKLPDEIIAEVFLALVDSYDEQIRATTTQKNAGDAYPWLVVTHVCARWRAIALDFPFMWCQILASGNSKRLERLTTFLKRSKNSPITIACSGNRPKLDALDLLARETHRWKEVAGLKVDNMFVEALRGAPLSLPLAERVSISFRDEVLDLGLSRESNPVLDPDLPSLKLLVCTSFPWPVARTWIKPSLLGLKVFGKGNSAAPRPAVAEWVEVLRSLPQLELLILDHAIARSDMADDDYMVEDLESTVELPRLKFLELNAGDTRSLNACAWLARHIQSPWRTRVNIELACRTPLPPDVYLVFFMCLSYRMAHVVHSALGDGRLCDVHIGWCNDQFFLNAVSKDEDTGAADVVLHTAVPSEDTDAPAWRHSAEQLFTDLAGGCDLFYALRLVVHNLGTDPAPWRAFDARHPAEALTLWTEALPAFVSAMEGALRARKTFMPRLAALTVNRFPPSARLPIPRPGVRVGRKTRPVLQRLADVLYAREQAGFPETDVDLHGGEGDCASLQTDEEIMARLRKQTGVLCEHREPGMVMRFGLNMQRGLFD